MNRPQTIQIFLPDGTPRGVKIAEITNRVVKAVFVPRNKLDYISKREELKSVGLYFLLGEDSEKAKPMVYIGEAEDCQNRLKQHHGSKEFWTHAIAMVSKINAFTKSHVKYLEHVSISQAKESNRFVVENGVIPSKPFVTESMEADLLDSFDTIKVLLSTLGYPVFEGVSQEAVKQQQVFQLTGRGISGQGTLIDDGFIVYRGSEAVVEETKSCSEYLVSIRAELVRDEVLEPNGNKLVLKEDRLFNSPSMAASILLGRNTNGWTQWKTKAGKTLDETRRG